MSVHLDRLESAIYSGDIETITKYADGTVLFPYQGLVQIYLETLKEDETEIETEE